MVMMSQPNQVRTAWEHLRTFTVVFVGLSCIGLAAWSSPVAMVICCCIYGLFTAAFGPTLVEVTFLLTGAHNFHFALGFLLISNALGWLVGAPAAGRYFCFRINLYL